MIREKSAYYGFVIGDCLGVPYEFRQRGTFNCKEIVGFGTHNQEKGTWSDDTSLLLSLLDSSSIEEHKNNLLDWVNRGKYCCDDTLFDIGYSTKTAINSSFSQKTKAAAGNGALLRCISLAFTQASEETIIEYLKLTHDNEVVFQWSLFLIDFVRNLNNLNKERAIELSLFNYPIHLQGNLSSTGYIKDTVSCVVDCFLKTTSFKEAILRAVNLGGDTDSIAALTGFIAGYYYNKISFKKDIRNLYKIEQILEKRVTMSTLGERMQSGGYGNGIDEELEKITKKNHTLSPNIDLSKFEIITVDKDGNEIETE